MPRLQCTYRGMHSTARRKIGEGDRTGEWQYEVWIDGKLQTKVTVPDGGSRRNQPIPNPTLKSIQRQLKLERDEFISWLDCPIGRSEYEQILRERLGL